jgi:hypothetical protein
MRTLISVAFLCFAVVTQALAADTPPSEASIRRLMAATDSKKTLDSALTTIDASMNNGLKAALANEPMSEQGQQIIDDMRQQLTAVVKEALTWNDLEPLFIEVYKRSLTQSEVDGMIRFYESEAGKAVVRKMPLIVQNTTQLMQERMKAILPKMMQIERDAIAKAKAASQSGASPAH